MNEIIDLLPSTNAVCILVKKAFDNQFCKDIIESKQSNFKKANTHYPTSYRNNERQVKDDANLSETLFGKIKQFVPQLIQPKAISEQEFGEWELIKLNSRLRFCRYLPNQYFNKHLDGIHFESEDIQSKLTFMVYLNGTESFSGGRTLFFKSKEDNTIIQSYVPEKGDLMIFDHNIWHSGEIVSSGEKYILRSDILYKRVSPLVNQKKKEFGESHLGYIWAIEKIGNRFITAGRDRTIKIWTSNGSLLNSKKCHDNSILTLLSLNEQLFISGSRDQNIKFWFLEKDDYVLSNQIKIHEGTVLCLTKLNNETFLSSGADGIVNLISYSGELLSSFKAHQEWVWGIGNINQNTIITIGEDGLMKVWNLSKQKLITSWEDDCPINSICINSESEIIIGNNNGFISILSFSEQHKKINLIARKYCHNGIIRQIRSRFNQIVSGGEDNKVKFWDKNLNLAKEYKHKNFVQDFIIDKNSIISVSYDGQIKKMR